MLLSVEKLNVCTQHDFGFVNILADLNFTLERGVSLGVVGESGCGKSMTALAIMGLLPENMTASGKILFDGDLLNLPEKQLCRIRGNRIGMVFQEPMTALNPVQPIGHQVAESLRLHRNLSRHEAQSQASRVLERVGLPKLRFSRSLYPHQLSGGQRQRVVIAIAIACEPDLLIADEPTTALDVTGQAQILELVSELLQEQNMALILITHDLGVVAENTEQMLVMYAGQIVERGPTPEVFERLAHPYTRGLFSALPDVEKKQPTAHRKNRLFTIPGCIPEFWERSQAGSAGCLFAQRCSRVQTACRLKIPDEIFFSQKHATACFYPCEQEEKTEK